MTVPKSGHAPAELPTKHGSRLSFALIQAPG